MGWEDLLEYEMATRSSILAWKISWTEQPGRVQYAGPQRVGHNRVIEHTHTHTCQDMDTKKVPSPVWGDLKRLPARSDI